MRYSPPKGTYDIVPVERDKEHLWRESHRWQYLEEELRAISRDFGFREIRIPMFEQTELFVRSVGQHSDIVSKEMYTFEDRAGRSMTLRPEGTAGVMRVLLEKNLLTLPGLHKYFYMGAMFRYDRPQAGRYRQLHQFGVEAVGSPDPAQDVEIIALLCTLFERLQLKDLRVHINSIGDLSSREAYKAALRDFLAPHASKLSPESQHRFTHNILRILDSKDAGDQELLQSAPHILDYLKPEAKGHFEHVLALLGDLKIAYDVQPKLVRGLDYYTDTVFEVLSGELGAQNALGGGGRYNGLSETLGGPPLPAVGFSLGLERILQAMLKQGAIFPPPPHPTVFLIPLGEEAKRFCIRLTQELREERIPADCELSGKKVGPALHIANAVQAEYALIVGDNELSAGTAMLKHLETREQTTVPFADLIHTLKDKCYA